MVYCYDFAVVRSLLQRSELQDLRVRVPATEITEFHRESLGCAFVFLDPANDEFTRLFVVHVDRKKIGQKYGEFVFDLAVSNTARVRVEEFKKTISKNPRFGYCQEFPRGKPAKIYKAKTCALELKLEQRKNSHQFYASASLKNVTLKSEDASELVIKNADVPRKVVGWYGE